MTEIIAETPAELSGAQEVAARDAAAETILPKLETLDLPFDTPPVRRIRSAIMKGIPAVPIMPGEKRPGDYQDGRWVGLFKWRSFTDTTLAWNKLEQWEAGAKDGAGVGVLTGEIVGIDIDVLDPDLAEQVTDAAIEILGRTDLIRTGRAPKRLMVYRTKEPFDKMMSGKFSVAGQECRIEVLGRGQQFVVDGIHPHTGEPYRWSNRSILSRGVEKAPWITHEQVGALLSQFEFLADAAGGEPIGTVADAGDHQSADSPLGDLATLTAALEHVPGSDDYDTWVRTGLAIKRALPDQPGEAFDLWDNWSQRAPHLYDPQVCAEKWETFDVDDRDTPVGAGTILKAAYANGWNGRADASMDFDPLLDEPREVVPAFKSRFRMLSAVRPVLNRPRLVKGLFPTRGVGWIYGDPGSRKSQIALDLALALSSGEPWIGRKVQKRAVVYSSAEGIDDLDNRLEAALSARQCGRELPLVTLPGFLLNDHKDFGAFKDELRAWTAAEPTPLGLIIIDTLFAHAPGVDISQQPDMTKLTRGMRELSVAFGCFVLGVHHKPKSGNDMFGSAALRADADVMLEVIAESGRSKMIADKLRGDPGGWSVWFDAQVFVLGPDEDGEPTTAPYVVWGKEAGFDDLTKPKNESERTFLEVSGADWVLWTTHVDEFAAKWTELKGCSASSARKAHHRAREALEARGVIEVHQQDGKPFRLRICRVDFN